MEVKICNICNIEKNILDFHKRKDSKDKLRNECKNCTRLKINNYRQNNKCINPDLFFIDIVKT